MGEAGRPCTGGRGDVCLPLARPLLVALCARRPVGRVASGQWQGLCPQERAPGGSCTLHSRRPCWPEWWPLLVWRDVPVPDPGVQGGLRLLTSLPSA